MSSPGRAGVYVEMCADPTLAEMEQNDWNIYISRYADTSEEEERTDAAEAVRKLRELERDRAAAETMMNLSLEELGYSG